MSVVRRTIKGQKFWVIDRTFRSAEGVQERYRRVAQVQTRPAAESEERGIIDYWTKHGTILPLMKPELRPKKAKTETSEEKQSTWDDAVEHFRAVVLPKKKPSTRKGYEAVLTGPSMKRWEGVPLAAIVRPEIDKWDTSIATSGVTASTRRNQHIVLRSVIKSVGPIDGQPGILLSTLPSFPRLPFVGETAVDAPAPEDVSKLLTEVDDDKRQPVWSARRRKARLAFGLAGLAGMRASEIRALRRKDVDLRRELIIIRLARVDGEEDTPKSGHEREIPIAAQLLPLLKEACRGLEPTPTLRRPTKVSRGPIPASGPPFGAPHSG